jgi:hypothetical protein
VPTAAFALLFALSGCGGCGEPPGGSAGAACESNEDCAGDLVCSQTKVCEKENGQADPDAGSLPIDETDGGPEPAGDGGVIDEPDAGNPIPEQVRDPDPTLPVEENLAYDSDCDGISDADEYATVWPGGEKTDPADWDSDDDGVPDGVEAGKTEAIDPACTYTPSDWDASTTTDPTNPDTDGDCIPDGVEDRNANGNYESGQGETDPLNTDSDADGVPDGDVGGEDADCDGVVDVGESDPRALDTDGDGLNDGVEIQLGTDPSNADSDGDGIPDGTEVQNGTDPTVANPDADADGIPDDVETANGTDPAQADTDGDGLCDGSLAVPGTCVSGEDLNGNGRVDPGESDPHSLDSDCDGVGDHDETVTWGSDPLDGDTDGDGLRDGIETGATVSPEPSCPAITADADPATTTDPTLLDTDGDGKNDGVEDLNRDGALGPAATNVGDPQETDASNPDTDGDGLCDGPGTVATFCVAGEDINADGRQNGNESNPRALDIDSDGDGLTDSAETALGLPVDDPDADNDGLCDGPGTVAGVCVGGEDLNGNGLIDANESDPFDADTDCDAAGDLEETQVLMTDPNDPDSDNDGLNDGVEVGRTEPIETQIPGALTTCTNVPVDADNDAAGFSQSNPLSADSDNDGMPDGVEDRNRDGAIDDPTASPRETSPSLADSDADGLCDGALAAAGCNAGEDLNANGTVDPGETDPRQPDIDTDGDGIVDWIETSAGLDPASADTDGDGLCDGPLVPAMATCVGGEDMDADGVVDPGETNPLEADTDCDALSDGEEITLGTNPLMDDSDGDLLTDGLESGVDMPVAGAYGCPTAPVDADPTTTTDPVVRDTDGDGLGDGLEDLDRNGALAAPNPGGLQETDPELADTDGDGVCDGPATVGACVSGEDINRNGRTDPGETDPRVVNVDTDGDGLDDGDETNTYGTNPNVADTDGDGLDDGDEVGRATDPLSIDTDCDGVTDGDEVNTHGTDPLRTDTDGDGLSDGIELGTSCTVGTQTDASCTSCVADGDNGVTTTLPTNPDSDGDGVVDGAEDVNGNGIFEAGELNPNLTSDADDGAINAACANPIDPNLHGHELADVLLATAPEIAISNPPEAIVSGGNEVGITVVDSTNNIVAFALTKTPEGANAAGELSTIQGRIDANVGNVLVPVAQNFNTWDGYNAAILMANLNDNGQTNANVQDVVRQVLGDASATVPFRAAVSEAGPFRMGLEVVRRADTGATLVVGVLTQQSAFDNTATNRWYRLEDIGYGTALGQYYDTVGVACDAFVTQDNPEVDFIWVIDDSGSMNDAQVALTAASTAMAAQLDNSELDWRVAIVTTEYYTDTGTGNYDDFTNDSTTFQNNAGSVGTSGDGDERGFQSLQRILNDRWLSGGPADGNAARIRPNAQVVILFLTDAGDQSRNADGSGDGDRPATDDVFGWTAFSNGGTSQDNVSTPNDVSWDQSRTNEPPLILAGILCVDETILPPGAPNYYGCSGEDGSGTNEIQSSNSRSTYYDTIANMNGITGVLSDNNGDGFPDQATANAAIGQTITQIVDAVIGQVSPYQLSNPPISSTLKVALEGPLQNGGANCGAGLVGNVLADVPRSRQDGFVYNAAANRIAFFGDCRPTSLGTDIAVSYRTWIEGDPPLCDDCPPPFICVQDQCVCPSDCGTGGPIPPEQTCNSTTCQLECLPDCGGCPLGQVCDPTPGNCSCSCPADPCDNPPAGFACNPSTCELECQGCPGTQGTNAVCNMNTCEYECSGCGTGDAPARNYCNISPDVCDYACMPDCGGCPGNTTCNMGDCACECPADCGSPSPGPEWTCDQATCQYQCTITPDPADAPSPNSVWDAVACEWTCPADCGGSPPGDLYICDTVSCTFTCPVDCGGCAGNTECNVNNCACECPADCGGPAPGPEWACNTTTCAYECSVAPDPATRPGPNFEWDASLCDWACPDACGEDTPPVAPFTCDEATCTATCALDCGGTCGANESCNTDTCACECDATTTCQAGFVFDANSCACVCDANQDCPASIPGCMDTHNLDTDTCAWTCKTDAQGIPDCGGCVPGFSICRPNTCECEIISGG